MNAPAAPPREEPSAYLPDFCGARVVLTIVLVAALLAAVLAHARQGGAQGDFLVDLGRTSAYLLWTALLCAAALCKSRPWLAQQSLRASSIAALVLLVGTVALVSEGVFWFRRFWEGRAGVDSGIFPTRHWAFLLPNLGISAIVGALALRYFYVASEWKRSVVDVAMQKFKEGITGDFARFLDKRTRGRCDERVSKFHVYLPVRGFIHRTGFKLEI